MGRVSLRHVVQVCREIRSCTSDYVGIVVLSLENAARDCVYAFVLPLEISEVLFRNSLEHLVGRDYFSSCVR